jgi:protein-S-isoprenylcysteine O-methyltransferase Ste14
MDATAKPPPALLRAAGVVLIALVGLLPSIVVFFWIEALGRNPGLAWVLAWAAGWQLLELGIGSPFAAAALDIGLLLAFGAIHSGLAQRRPQELLARIVGAAAVRGVYVMVTGLALWLVMVCWHPVDATLWVLVPNSPAADRAGMLAFWILFAAVGFVIAGPGFLEFLGFRPMMRGVATDVQQVGRGKLVVGGAYRWVKHPGYALLLLGLLCSNRMTADRMLVFAGVLLYLVLFGMRLEEDRLEQLFGEPYADYRRRVPALVPLPLTTSPGPEPGSPERR